MRRGSFTSGATGNIVLGWLTRIAVVLSLLGLVAFEVLSIAVTNVSLQDVGAASADAALTEYSQHHNAATAYEAAAAYAESQGATIPKRSFIMNPDGSVGFEVRKTAPTLVIYRIGPLAKFAKVVVSIDSAPVESTGSLP